MALALAFLFVCNACAVCVPYICVSVCMRATDALHLLFLLGVEPSALGLHTIKIGQIASGAKPYLKLTDCDWCVVTVRV